VAGGVGDGAGEGGHGATYFFTTGAPMAGLTPGAVAAV
jgi:hypothetical protein